MNAISLHDAFVGQGCEGAPPQPAVSVGAGRDLARRRTKP